MKEIKYNVGGQPFYIEDDQLQQEEIFKAIEKQFADTNGLVLSGCVVTGTSISAGLVYLDGKIRELQAATGLTFPCYIKAAPTLEYDSRIHVEDNQNKTTKRAYNAEITTTLPTSGDYITVTAQGCNKRLQYVIKNDQNNQYTPAGFELNNGKVSYVKAYTGYINNISTSGSVFTNYTEVEDTLNEFDAITGEFTALQAGLYMVAGSARLDFDNWTSLGASIDVQKFVSSWEVECFFTINFPSGSYQQAFALSCVVRLNAEEKMRFRAVKVGGTNINAKIELLNICRIA